MAVPDLDLIKQEKQATLLADGAADRLAATGKVRSFGRGRARCWLTPPVPGLATTLLLPAPLLVTRIEA
jgi:hypothetical protein